MDVPQTSVVAAAFAEYLRRRDEDPEYDFEAYCAGQPDVAGDLRSIYDNWQRLVGDSDGKAAPVTGELPRATAWRELLARLALHEAKVDRYEFLDTVNRGGMGEILEVWDPALHRRLAMKVIRERSKSIDERILGRFLEEAQVTSQLDHPGIVPVHELALDANGRVYFTMKLVRGVDLRVVFQDIHAGRDGWSQTRGLGVLLRVCEALAFAHDRGVVHRDLKPANIMVGRFGETYVMDWGLAKVHRGERPVPTENFVDSASRVKTDRQRVGKEKPDLTVLTQDGDFVGTPMYTSPEQALSADQADALSDCYAVGAILYELLTGEPPFQRPPTGSVVEVRTRVLAGPPAALLELAPRTPPPLVALCEKAMERDRRRRYQSMAELAAELRAFLENRVVKAYRTGPLVEFRLWVVRNRAVAAALAAILVIALGATIAVAVVEKAKNRELRLVADLQLVRALVEQPEPFAIRPEDAPRMQAWLQRAESLRPRQREYREEYDQLRARFPAVEGDDGSEQLVRQAMDTLSRKLRDAGGLRDKRHAILADPAVSPEERQRAARTLQILATEMPRWTQELAALQARPLLPDLVLPTAAEQVRCRQLIAFLRGADELFAVERGAVARGEADLRSAALIESWSISGEEVAAQWRLAITSIGNADECPLYRGLVVRPQLGLVPLGRNPQGLWEFWHVLSGTKPQVAADGRIELAAESGMVFVLVPGGRLLMGAQRDDPAGPNYDPDSEDQERPVHEVEVGAFFLSKYEMTQAQWVRATGDNPSALYAGSDWRAFGEAPPLTVSQLHPVERVSWWDCERMLGRWDLEFPGEAEFEWAQRGGTTGPFWFAKEAIAASVNAYGDADRFQTHAPVDRFPPNPLGFCSISGNVMEWCRDWYVDSYEERPARSGLLVNKAVRGGGYRNRPSGLRATYRSSRYPDTQEDGVGVRPCRRLQ